VPDDSPNDALRGLANLPRTDWYQKVTGRAEYIDDCPDPLGTVFGAPVRSTQSHARILRIRPGAALALPGVLGVFDRDRLDGLDPIVRIGEYAGHTRQHGESADQHLLAVDKVRFPGDLIGLVVAEDLATARLAADLVEVDYAPLPAMFSYREAMADGAPLIHEDLPDNLACRGSFDWGDVDAGLAGADLVVQASYYTPTAFHHPMEAVGSCLADFTSQGVTLWLPTNKIFNPVEQIVELFGVAARDVRVRTPAIGGAFGAKQITPAMMCALAMSRRLRRPVRLVATEADSFRSTARHACLFKARAGLTAEGCLTALDVDLEIDTGAYFTGASMVNRQICISSWGCYRLPAFRVRGRTAYTNKVPAASFRATGKTESTFGVECLMDRLAQRIEMSPAEFRRKNVLRPGDRVADSWRVDGVRTPVHAPPMDTDYDELMDRAMAGIGWDGKPNPSASAGAGHRVRGHGLALSLRQGAPAGGRTYAVVALDQSGQVHVHHAAPDLGEGVATMLRVVAANALGIEAEHVVVEPPEMTHGLKFEGTAAQRTTIHMGNAVVSACAALKDELRAVLALTSGGTAQDWVIEGGMARRAGEAGDETFSLRDIARNYGGGEGGAELKGLGAFGFPRSEDRAFGGLGHWAPGAVAVEVEVDTETGGIELVAMAGAGDAGRVLHRASAMGQLSGGAILGAGLALSEEVVYDDGKLVNGDAAGYRLPSAANVPDEIPVWFLERADGPGPFGAKGLAQVTVPCVTPAVNNAIMDAVGVHLDSAPLTPEKVLRALGVIGEAGS
jgi:CO/xanthine dehydrogenase Mo-binding subunit